MASRQRFTAVALLLALSVPGGCDDEPLVPVTLVDAIIPADLPGLAGDYSLGGSPP